MKHFKPTSPGQRAKTVSDFKEITTDRPEKSLCVRLKRHSGHNAQGRITSRFRGGGHRKIYRMIDFKRDKHDIQGTVATVEYDPNRSANIALIHYKDGEKRYILAPLGLKVGQPIEAGENADIVAGNSLPLRRMPLGTLIHNIELKPKKGGQIVRSAGSFAQLLTKEKGYCHVRLPSGEIRLILADCYASIGQLGNTEHGIISIGKAGRNRWMGWRPHVRGVAMNPVDHPLGGGEGRTSGGRHPCSPWGQPAKGFKTRNNKATDKFIVQRRNKK